MYTSYPFKKDGDLDFREGDVITILDPPPGTPRGWLYGEVNVARRGFFPGTSVTTIVMGRLII